MGFWPPHAVSRMLIAGDQPGTGGLPILPVVQKAHGLSFALDNPMAMQHLPTLVSDADRQLYT